jgi:HSP20 family molecular chaperone IbpA
MDRTFRGNWMWAEACDLVEQAERLRREFFRLGRTTAAGPAWEPPIDVCDDGEEVWVEIALPGIAPASLQVAVEGTAIEVRAERPLPAGARRGRIVRLEIPYGRFERRIELPPGRYELGRRELAQGCIQLVLRRL